MTTYIKEIIVEADRRDVQGFGDKCPYYDLGRRPLPARGLCAVAGRVFVLQRDTIDFSIWIQGSLLYFDECGSRS